VLKIEVLIGVIASSIAMRELRRELEVVDQLAADL
jgi:hypothetical protein